ncbi:MAG: GNAT family N-acetyltransferase [Acidimicrobiia bacterium]|nr:GNAT family N-acetyltransferase [Acidimicrobiia bacterium]
MNSPPGVTLRRFEGDTDYAAMAVCINETAAADGDERFETAEGLAHSYAYLENCDPKTDMLFAEADGEIVAYSRVMWHQVEGGDNERLYGLYGWVRPAWRRRGIGSTMLEASEARLREIAAGHDHDGLAYFETGAFDQDAGAGVLFAANGYDVAATDVEMVRPNLDGIPQAVLPDGLEVRPVTDDQIRQIWEASDEAFRDHWSYVPASEEYYAQYTSETFFDPSLWRVAWDGDEVAGQVRSFINKDENQHFGYQRGYTEDISVRRPYRRRGLARALLLMSLEAVRDRGMTEAGLGVHVENPNDALSLYESVGFAAISRWFTYRKPFS